MNIDERKLNSIFLFLKSSKEFSNYERIFYYKFLFGSCDNKTERFNRLVYSVFNSSSQPNLEHFLSSYSILFKSWNESSGSLLKLIGVNEHVEDPYNKLFMYLKSLKGWGDKISALFVKHIIKIHNEPSLTKYKIFNENFKISSNGNDKVYLPVDAVIIYIFSLIDISEKKITPNFEKINRFLQKKYSCEDLIIWDELWYWGFIGTKGPRNSRKLEWNRPKYFSLEGVSKVDKDIKLIKSKTEEFIDLIVK